MIFQYFIVIPTKWRIPGLSKKKIHSNLSKKHSIVMIQHMAESMDQRVNYGQQPVIESEIKNIECISNTLMI